MNRLFNYFFLVTIILCLSAKSSNPQTATNSDDSWEKIDKLIEQQLPKSALEELQKLEVLAENNNSAIERIKIQQYKFKINIDLDSDSTYAELVDFERFAESLKAHPEQELTYNILAELYLQYYKSKRYTIDRRTDLSDNNLPSDFSTWTKKHYVTKIYNLLEKSWQNQEVSKETPLLPFQSVFFFYDNKNNDAPTVFDYIAKKRISVYDYFGDEENKNQALLSLLNFRKEQSDTTLTVLTELKLINHLNQSEQYLTKLDSLEQVYNPSPSIVEILNEKAQYYLNHTEINHNKKKAYDICKYGIATFPDYRRIGLLQNTLNQIENQSITINAQNQIKPYSELSLDIETENIKELTIEVYKLKNTAEEFILGELNKRINTDKQFDEKELVETLKVPVSYNENFEITKTNYKVKAKDYGIYECVAYPSESKDKNNSIRFYFTTTDFGVIKRAVAENEIAYYVVDRITGKCIKNVDVGLFEYKWAKDKYQLNPVTKGKTNSKGLVEFRRDKTYGEEIIVLNYKGDKFFSSFSYTPYYYTSQNADKEINRIDIITDRAIYRPGQTVYFKAISYVLSETKQQVTTKQNINIELIDANGQVVSTKELKTNEFGSASGEFILPSDVLSGYFSLRANRQFSQSFSVEEYKRPSFEILLPQPKHEISFGKNVVISGEAKSYAGYGLSNSTVKYKIIRYIHPFWRWIIPSSSENIIKSGETTTDDKGNFTIDFVPAKDKNISDINIRQVYNYKIEVDITDQKGESQQQQIFIPIGEQSVFIFAEIPNYVEKQKTNSFKVSTKTITGENITKDLTYKIFRIIDTNDFIDIIDSEKTIKEKLEICSSTYSTQNEQLNLDLSNYTAGRYKIEFSTKDTNGQDIKTGNYFILYDKRDKKPPVKTYLWSLDSDIECAVGETALVHFGTSVKDANVLMEVMNGNNIISSKWLNISNKITIYKIPFTEKYRSGITINFTFVRDEKMFQKTIRIKEKKVSKNLSPRLTVFRDKLKPGEEVEWTVNIPELSSLNKKAEIVAGMYDASLDALQVHNWHFNPVYYSYFPEANKWISHFRPAQSYYYYNQDITVNIPEYRTPSISLFGLFTDTSPYVVGYGRRRTAQKTGSANLLMEKVEVSEALAAPTIADDSELINQRLNPDAPKQTQQIQQIRTNFQETAFFYPQLKTDVYGNVQVKFTMPESLTKWKLNILAHTDDLYFGKTTEEIITQQDLMVQLNTSRFVRQSDIIELKANVVNFTDKKQKAQVKLAIIDPSTEKIILLNDTNTINIEIDSNESQTVSWKVQDFGHRDLIICKVTAQTDNMTDGEQKYLPVLSDQVLVTESFPFTVNGNKLTELQFDKIVKDYDKVDTKQLKLDFTANPFWNAIQAIPVLSTPQNENAIDYFIAWYVNTLAYKITEDNPYIKKAIEELKLSGNKNLQSELFKKTDLKNIDIDKTPWLSQAKNETERQLRLSLLLDLNQMRMQREVMFNKLQELQLANGAFEWFVGLGENRWVTQFIVEGLVKAKDISEDKNIDDMITRAISYLDSQLNKDYLHLKAKVKDYDKKRNINSLQLNYLSTRVKLQSRLPYGEINEAIQFYLKQIETYQNKMNLYDRASAAITLYYTGKTESYSKIVKSLLETASESETMGMFWSKNKAGYFWNERPIAVHTKLMEAIELDKSQQTEKLKIWLLRQKQTTSWDSPISTINAIYALTKGSGESQIKGKAQYTLATDTKVINTSQGSLGTGNVNFDITIDEIKKGVKVHPSENTGTISQAWGAIYWQYYQNQSDVTSSGKELKIQKQMYVEKIINNKKTLIAINKSDNTSQSQQIKIGDKIISRMIVRADRSYEFVALKDERASNLEPVRQISGCQWKENLLYYRTVKDTNTQYFFSFLPQGTYVFEDEYFVNNAGKFSGGIASVQCLYAPEFAGISSGENFNTSD